MAFQKTPVVDSSAAAKIAAAVTAITDQKRFVLVNPSPDQMTPTWDGFTIYIPGREDVRLSPAGKNVFESYKDPVTKKHIPGTLMVWDIYTKTSLGEKKAWDVSVALRHILGVKGKGKGFVYEGTFGAMGLGVVLDGADRETVEECRAQGLIRWRTEEQAVAAMRVRTWDERNVARKRDGLSPMEDTEEIREARQVVDLLGSSQRNALLKRYDIEDRRGGAATATTAP